MMERVTAGEVDIANTDNISTARRILLAGLLGGAVMASPSNRAEAQVSSSVDPDPLQIYVNMLYTSVNYSQTGFYADGDGGRRLGVDLIRAGELTGQPVIEAIGARPTPFNNEAARGRMNELLDDLWNRLVGARRFLRGDAPGQRLVDLSPAVFTAMFRMAGAIGPSETFDPYLDEGNFVLGYFALTDFYPSALRGLTSMVKDGTVRAWWGGLASATGNNCANLRALIVDLSAERPEIITMADKISAWHNQISGMRGPDRRIWLSGANATLVANMMPTDADGLVAPMLPAQIFNILFMTSSAATQGGFFPNGVNGKINTSATN